MRSRMQRAEALMGKLSNVKVGDTRADGAVCTKVEWVAKDACGSGLYVRPPGFFASKSLKMAR